MAARKAASDEVVKKAGGHVKTPLDDKPEEEQTIADKAEKTKEAGEEKKAKKVVEMEEESKKAKEKDGETWTSEMPVKILGEAPHAKRGLFE